MKKALGIELILGILGNILSVVGVVLCNKYIITMGFNFTMVLSACHFAFTWLGCHMMLRMNYFKYKKGSWKNVLPVALGSLSSVAFMNLNLSYNSVGFYQLSKLMCIPFTIAVQRVIFRQEASLAVKLSLIPILFGVGLATVHDLSLNLVGTFFAALAVIFTTFSQFFTQRYQAVLECNALQLLYLTSPLICAGMLLLAPFFDNLPEFYAFLRGKALPMADGSESPSSNVVVLMWVFISCLLALGVNVTNYLVLGKTSPLTYQVLGHLKTVLILILGVVLFHSPVDVRQVGGVVSAIGGVVFYTEAKRKERERGSHTSGGSGKGGSQQKLLPR